MRVKELIDEIKILPNCKVYPPKGYLRLIVENIDCQTTLKNFISIVEALYYLNQKVTALILFHLMSLYLLILLLWANCAKRTLPLNGISS